MGDTERSRRRRDSARYRRYREHVKRALGFVCHLCGGPIDPELPGTHPLGWTLHHTHPISHGGELRSGGVPAHRRCNIAFGNGRRRINSAGDPSENW